MVGLDVENTHDMSFDVDASDDGTVTVTLSGELDMTNVDALAAAVELALEQEPERLIVEVQDLSFADSSAIALWVQWATKVPAIEMRDVRPLLRRVVESMGLTETLNLAP